MTIPFFNLNLVLIVLVNVLAILIGGVVFKHNPKGKINRLLSLMAFLMLVWVNFAFIPRAIGQENPDLALSLLKVAWFVTPLFFTSIYFLAISLLEKEKKYKILNGLVLFAGLLAAFLTGFTDLVVESIRFIGPDMAINYGAGMWPFLGLGIFLMFSTLCVLFIEYFKSSPSLKLKLQYLLIGVLIFYLANFIFNITLPVFFDIVRFYWIADYSAIFLLGFMGYAILARQLFGIKIILTQALVIGIAILLLAQAITATNWLDLLWKFTIFILFLFFGWLLIKSVTREIEQRERLAEAYVKLQQLDKAKTEFLSIASHQLRTPLTAIKGYISMMLEEIYGKPPEKMVKPLESIYSSNERLIKLVNDLLNISRIETGKVEVNMEKLSLEELVQEAVEEMGPMAEKRGLYLKLEKPAESLPKTSLDKEKIRQVITNIIDNALKYTEKGGVTVKLQKTDHQLQITISDTGDGLSQEEVSHLFTSFTRGKAGTRLWVEGAGLGLYIAKKFMELHNGKIWAESHGKGRGSTFYIELLIESSEETLIKKL